jgi:predicted N-acetyltransferase YhbS
MLENVMERRWEIETASESDYRELTGFLDRAFGFSGDFFRVGLGHIYSPEEMEWNWVVRDEGRIVGVFGRFPMRFRSGEVVLEALGIGGVSADPAYRGQGIMSTFLEAAQEDLWERGCDISWLGGDRERYGRYGWEHAGFRRQTRIDAKAPWSVPAAGRVVDPREHLEEIDRMFQAMPLRTERSREMLKRHIERPEFVWWVGEGAYAVQRKPHAGDVLELCGSAWGAEGVLRAVYEGVEGPMRVQVPNDDHEVSLLVRRLAMGAHMGPISSLKIVDLASTLTKLIPVMERNLAPTEARCALNLVMLDPLPGDPGFVQIVNLEVNGGRVAVRAGAGKGATLTLDRREMVGLVFGRWGETANVPEGFGVLRHLLPAPLFVYELDFV